ncbi:MAG: peroxidase [Thermoanaerobaculia bacterium]
MAEDDRAAELDSSDRQMLDFAVKLTRTPGQMTAEDVEGLRQVGFDDVAIHDIVQVCALFNYYNRLADGLGIDPEE